MILDTSTYYFLNKSINQVPDLLAAISFNWLIRKITCIDVSAPYFVQSNAKRLTTKIFELYCSANLHLIWTHDTIETSFNKVLPWILSKAKSDLIFWIGPLCYFLLYTTTSWVADEASQKVIPEVETALGGLEQQVVVVHHWLISYVSHSSLSRPDLSSRHRLSSSNTLSKQSMKGLVLQYPDIWASH